MGNIIRLGRSQWPRGLSMKCLRLLEHWDRMFESQLEAWMSLCVYSVFVLSCVQVASALRRADPPSHTDCVNNQDTEEAAEVQHKDCRAIDK
jgi:hypothetical protein